MPTILTDNIVFFNILILSKLIPAYYERELTWAKNLGISNYGNRYLDRFTQGGFCRK